MTSQRGTTTRLKYIADCNIESLPESTDPDFHFAYVDISAVSQGRMEIPEEMTAFSDAPSRARRVASVGDTVLSTVRTYLRAVSPVPDHVEPVVFSTGFAILHPREGVDAAFLSWYLQGDEFVSRVEAASTGVSYPAITATDVMAMGLTLPPLSEQRAIADYLNRETAQIDTLIAKQEQLITTLRERRSASVENAFGGAPQDTRLRSAIDHALTGPFGSQLSADEYVSGGVPVVNPTHIRRGALAIDPSVSVSGEKAQSLGRFALALGDIVLGRKGEVDKSALIDLDSAGFICGSDSMAVRPRESTNPKYLWWFFQSPGAHAQLEKWSVGSTVSGLNQRTISEIVLPLGDATFQAGVVAHLDAVTGAIDILVSKAEHFIALARERRAALITAAVTGQVDVAA